jgi:hypothetical protein
MSPLPRAKGVLVASFLGYLITAGVLVAVPVILVRPEYRTEWFWALVLWSAFLALLRWFYVAGFMSLIYPRWRNAPGLGGILPGIGILVLAYTSLSYLLMLAGAISHPTGRAVRFFVAGQLVLTAAALVIGVFIYFVRAGAIADMEAIPAGVERPVELAARLRIEEDRLSPLSAARSAERGQRVKELHGAVKSLREKIEYATPQVGRVGANAGYVDFAGAVQALCDEMSALDLDALEVDRLQPTARRADSLRSKLESLTRSMRQG